jgi:hypothetical protein
MHTPAAMESRIETTWLEDVTGNAPRQKPGDKMPCTLKLRQTGRRLIGDTSAGFVSSY